MEDKKEITTNEGCWNSFLNQSNNIVLFLASISESAQAVSHSLRLDPYCVIDVITTFSLLSKAEKNEEGKANIDFGPVKFEWTPRQVAAFYSLLGVYQLVDSASSLRRGEFKSMFDFAAACILFGYAINILTTKPLEQ